MKYKFTREEEEILASCQQQAFFRACAGTVAGGVVSHLAIQAVLPRIRPPTPLDLIVPRITPTVVFDVLRGKYQHHSNIGSPYDLLRQLKRQWGGNLGMIGRFIGAFIGGVALAATVKNECVDRLIALNTVDEPMRSPLGLDLKRQRIQDTSKQAGFTYELDEQGLATPGGEQHEVTAGSEGGSSSLSPSGPGQQRGGSVRYSDTRYEGDENPTMPVQQVQEGGSVGGGDASVGGQKYGVTYAMLRERNRRLYREKNHAVPVEEKGQDESSKGWNFSRFPPSTHHAAMADTEEEGGPYRSQHTQQQQQEHQHPNEGTGIFHITSDSMENENHGGTSVPYL
eukprot:Nk52_evm1s2229 gene=Nk52_evmTU1s2229